jgi:HK97 gp10 family phage protein
MKTQKDIKILGLDKLDRSLKKLNWQLQKEIGQKALDDGGKIVQAAARSMAPVGKQFYNYPYLKRPVKNKRAIGQLKRSIDLQHVPAKGNVLLRTWIFPRMKGKRTGFYGIFLERGWTPTGPRGQWSSKRTRGGRPTGMSMKEWGGIIKARQGITQKQWKQEQQKGRKRISPRPFMGPALKKNVNQVISKIVDTIRIEIGKAQWRER